MLKLNEADKVSSGRCLCISRYGIMCMTWPGATFKAWSSPNNGLLSKRSGANGLLTSWQTRHKGWQSLSDQPPCA